LRQVVAAVSHVLQSRLRRSQVLIQRWKLATHWPVTGGWLLVSSEFDLTMDIYTPKTGRDSYPVLVIFHGGGWLINDKSVMDQTAKYLATNSELVICNINYRLLGDNGNTIKLNQIVNDAFGSVLWVKEHIGNYKGDQRRISVTGDSAGGHLAAMIVNSGYRLSSASYTETHMFLPTYLPQGVTPESVASSNGLAVQAAILSYPALDVYQNGGDSLESWKNPLWFLAGSMPRGVFGNRYNAKSRPELYKAISPLYSIPDIRTRILPPQLVLIGSEDRLIKPSLVQEYYAKLQQAGHPAQYWIHEGRGHAYLDSGSSFILGTSFERDAPEALNVMIDFLNNIFYP
jgi:acetyl esterase